MAKRGEIRASALVHNLVERTGCFAFEPPREVELKGLGGRVQVYAPSEAFCATRPRDDTKLDVDQSVPACLRATGVLSVVGKVKVAGQA